MNHRPLYCDLGGNRASRRPSLTVGGLELGNALKGRLLREIDEVLVLRRIDEELVLREVQNLQVRAGDSKPMVSDRSPAPKAGNHAHAAEKVLQLARLQSVGNWIQSQAEEKISELEDGLVEKIRAVDPTVGDRSVKEARLFSAADRIIELAFDAIKVQVEGHFEELAHAVAKQARAMREDHHGRAGGLPALDDVVDTSVLGAPLREHFDKLAGDCAFKFKAEVRKGLDAGDYLDDLVERIEGSDEEVKAGDKSGHEFHGNQWKSGYNTEHGSLKVSPSGYIRDVFIKKESRGKGHGRELFNKLFDDADRLKKTLKLSVSDTNPEAISFYKKIGFEEVGKDEFGILMERKPISAADPGTAVPVVTAGLAEDAAKEAAKKRLVIQMRLMDSTEGSINKVIQAAIAAFSRRAEEESAEEDDGEQAVERKMGWQWVAVMDPRTCEQCQFYDGSRWDEDHEPVGDAPEFPDDPPLHFGCRCTVVPSNLDDEAAPTGNFDEYLAGFSRSEQEEAFGKSNLRAYHRGDITAGQLIGQRSNLMTLEQFSSGGGSSVEGSGDFDESLHPRDEHGRFAKSASDNVDSYKATIHGYATTAVVRRLAAEGFTKQEIRNVMNAHGVPMADSTLNQNYRHGVKGIGDPVAPLTSEQLGDLHEKAGRGAWLGGGKSPEPEPPKAPEPKAPEPGQPQPQKTRLTSNDLKGMKEVSREQANSTLIAKTKYKGNFTEEQKRNFDETTKSATAVYHPQALRRALKNTNSLVFAKGKQLDQLYGRDNAESKIGGFYSPSKKLTVSVHEKDSYDYSPHAHELAHAIDRRQGKIGWSWTQPGTWHYSETDKWSKAWEKDKNNHVNSSNGRLRDYAWTDKQEGFACACEHAHCRGLDSLKKKAPNMAALLVKWKVLRDENVIGNKFHIDHPYY